MKLKLTNLKKEIKYKIIYLTKVEKAFVNKVAELEKYNSIWVSSSI